LKWCGKSAPRLWQQRRHGKPHREQDQIGMARDVFRIAVRVGRARRSVTNVPEEWSPLRKKDRTRLIGHLTLVSPISQAWLHRDRAGSISWAGFWSRSPTDRLGGLLSPTRIGCFKTEDALLIRIFLIETIGTFYAAHPKNRINAAAVMRPRGGQWRLLQGGESLRSRKPERAWRRGKSGECGYPG
jgi:hypothetical protein